MMLTIFHEELTLRLVHAGRRREAETVSAGGDDAAVLAEISVSNSLQQIANID